jgi:site-specific DNA-methyltransferase (adenine-specific)
MELNKIYNEDCMETMRRMPDKFVDVIFTSPPYNRKRNDKYKFYDDKLKDYFSFLKNSIQECIRVCKGPVFLNLQKNYYNKKDIFRILGEFYNEIFEIFVWGKKNPLPARGFSITNSYEFIVCFANELKSNKTYTKNFFIAPAAKMDSSIKTVMNRDVARFFIKNFTKPEDIIYDPFMGSGTTAKVALEFGRRYIGSEIIPEYCELAQNGINTEKGEK